MFPSIHSSMARASKRNQPRHRKKMTEREEKEEKAHHGGRQRRRKIAAELNLCRFAAAPVAEGGN
uniref:Uncharacterized protein n=1 Tax=Arundo donax TaxID=35708 RepID=A0A0A9ARZ1_ARUDO